MTTAAELAECTNLKEAMDVDVEKAIVGCASADAAYLHDAIGEHLSVLVVDGSVCFVTGEEGDDGLTRRSTVRSPQQLDVRRILSTDTVTGILLYCTCAFI